MNRARSAHYGFYGWLQGAWLICLFGANVALGALVAQAGAGPDIRTRALAEFAEGFLFKPAEAQTNDHAFGLAPLVIQELNGGQRSGLEPGDRFGSLQTTNGSVTCNAASPVVYYYPDAVELAGKTHARISYLWCYPFELSAQRHLHLPVQGVRLTLDSAGQPAVWEVLVDTSGSRGAVRQPQPRISRHERVRSAAAGPAIFGRASTQPNPGHCRSASD